MAAVEAWQRNAGRRREVDHSAGRAGDADSKRAACLLAKDAAPYRHPRLVPAPAGDTHLGLPALDSAEAIADATSRVIKALTVGELSLGTAQTVVAMRGEVRQAVEPSEATARHACGTRWEWQMKAIMKRRLDRLEQRHDGGGPDMTHCK